jgi:hypothetical protein
VLIAQCRTGGTIPRQQKVKKPKDKVCLSIFYALELINQENVKHEILQKPLARITSWIALL